MLALLIIPAGIARSEVNGDGNRGAGELDTLNRGSRRMIRNTRTGLAACD
jgi:hypothetical protein